MPWRRMHPYRPNRGARHRARGCRARERCRSEDSQVARASAALSLGDRLAERIIARPVRRPPHLNSVLQPLYDALAQTVATARAAVDATLDSQTAASRAALAPILDAAGPSLPDLQLPNATDYVRELSEDLAVAAFTPALSAGPSLTDLQLPEHAPAAQIRDLLPAARDITIPNTLTATQIRDLAALTEPAHTKSGSHG